ncbi:MAG: Gfo/Idh/MocA family oxidoreductase [Patescibacteria group bacterium]|nr:Gfo/Idh/MocA family oxidoreductase [Patescibacteria group bacterium]
MAEGKVGIGVMGAGGIARRRTIPGMLKAKNCKLVAVMDPVGVEGIAAEFKVPNAYATEKELLADPAVEAVYIASPLLLHAKQIRMAAAAGKHILCEKPLTLNLKQGEEAVAACKAAGVYLQEGYMMKFHGAHQRMKELIDEGRIGKVVSMRAQLSCWYPKMEGAWRQDPRQGGTGGALVDMATHLIDLMTMFAGPVRRVAALVGNLVQDYKPADATTTLLEFRGGAHGTVDCFFCIPDEASRTRLEVYGSQGALLSEGTIGQSTGGKLEGIFTTSDKGYDATQTKDVVRKFEPVPFPKVNPYTAECEYFAQCILDGRPPKINDGKNALTIQRIVEQALQSKKSKAILPV